jgi:hypothetical protein
MTDWEEKKKDEILQKINDVLEAYDWGGTHKKTVIKIAFKGKYWMLDPDVIIKDSVDSF